MGTIIEICNQSKPRVMEPGLSGHIYSYASRVTEKRVENFQEPEDQGVCCEVVFPANVSIDTHEVSVLKHEQGHRWTCQRGQGKAHEAWALHRVFFLSKKGWAASTKTNINKNPNVGSSEKRDGASHSERLGLRDDRDIKERGNKEQQKKTDRQTRKKKCRHVWREKDKKLWVLATGKCLGSSQASFAVLVRVL